MNVTNFEPRNTMATIGTDYQSNVYRTSCSGLIKSASTSSCCASEDALLKKLHQNKFPFKNVGNEGIENERLKLFVLQPLSFSEQNVPLLSSDENIAVKRNFHCKPRYNNLKHFSDCDLHDVSRSNTQIPSNTFSACAFGLDEFNTHRSLDNVLLCKGKNKITSIINFTAVNDFKSSKVHAEMPNFSSSRTSQHLEELSSNDNKSELDNTTNISGQQMCENSNSRIKCGDCDTNLTTESDAVTFITKTSENSNNDGKEPVAKDKDEKRFRRSSSLKVPKESTSSDSAQKKIVRFADAMGLDLADVRTFLDELPSVPKSAFDDLRNVDVAISSPTIDKLFSQSAFTFLSPAKSLVPMFKQPGISSNFLDRVRDQFVCLEHAALSDTPVCSITGTVRVRNLDFHKSVFVRYTSDNWQSYTEIQSVYMPDSCDGFSDKFSFILYLYHIPTSNRIEIAVRYHCCGSIFWDNNYGANYVFQSFSSAPAVPSYFHCFSSTNDTCNSFY